MANEERLNVVGIRTPADADVDERRTWAYERNTFLGDSVEDTDSLREYLSVIARHKLVVALCALLTPLLALVYSLDQHPKYEASASVLVAAGSAGSILSDIPGVAPTTDPKRLAATHVSLARLPIVAQRTVDAAGVSESAGAFLGRSTVSAETDTDLLRFGVTDDDAERATRLATAYAQQFTRYRNELDLQSLRSTRAQITQTLAKLAEQGQKSSALSAELASAVRRLDAAEAVRGSAAVVVQPATGAAQVGPRTKRNVALGLFLGLLYGVGIAFLIERLGGRLRTAEGVEAILGLRALGELPKPPDLSRSRRRVAMLEVPHGPYAESIRKLRANLEFVGADSGLGVIMVTSALPGEGKTTVAADLAVGFARSGRTVALCDLDARMPSLSRSLGLEGRRGLVDVVLGAEPLDRSLLSIPLGTSPGQATPVAVAPGNERDPIEDLIVGQQRAPRARNVGQLHFLPLGTGRPHDPGDFVGSESVRHVIARLRDTHDVVVVDTAPLLPVSDARVVSEYVDGTLLVSGLLRTSKRDLRKVRRLLSVLPTHVLGVVVTGVPPVPGYGVYGAEDVLEPAHGAART